MAKRMYILSILIEGEEHIVRADTVMLHETTIVVRSGEELKIFNPSDLVELEIVEDLADDGIAVPMEATRVAYRKS